VATAVLATVTQTWYMDRTHISWPPATYDTLTLSHTNMECLKNIYLDGKIQKESISGPIMVTIV